MRVRTFDLMNDNQKVDAIIVDGQDPKATALRVMLPDRRVVVRRRKGLVALDAAAKLFLSGKVVD